MSLLNKLIKQREKELKKMPAIEVKELEKNSKNDVDKLVFNKLNQSLYERQQNK